MRKVGPAHLILASCFSAWITSAPAADQGSSRAGDSFHPGLGPATTDGNWSRVPGFTPPANLYEPTESAYDPRARILYACSPRDGSCWKLDLNEPSWTALTIEGVRPPFRRWTAVAVDPTRDRLLMFGGEDGGFGLRGDLWELTLDSTPRWRLLPTTGQAPPARYGHVLIYDESGDRVLLFGGLVKAGLSQVPVNDVYSLTLGENPTWTRLSPEGTEPPASFDFAATLDASGQRLILVTGRDGTSPSNQTWILTLAGTPRWTQLHTTTLPPRLREGHNIIYDPARDRIVLFGGWSRDGSIYDDTWSLPLSGTPVWSEIPSAVRPSARWGHGMFLDPSRDGALIHGGEWGYSQPGQVHLDCWSLPLSELTGWQSLAGPPRRRSGHVAAHDSTRAKMYVYGGSDGIEPFGDCWSLPLEGSPWWTETMPRGDRPEPRESPAWIHDPVADRLVMFGGRNGLGYPTDVWALSLRGVPRWERLPAGPGPRGRMNHAAVYDPVGHRMIVLGGAVGVAGYCAGRPYGIEYPSGDVWALSLITYEWVPLRAWLEPWLGSGISCVYDRHRARVIVYGGMVERLEECGFHCCYVARDYGGTIRALDLVSGSVEIIAPSGTGPAARGDHAAIYDPLRQRMVVLGGETAQGASHESWSLSLSGTPAWSRLFPGGESPSLGSRHSAIYDVRSDAVWVYSSGEVWRLQWDEPLLSVEVSLRPGDGADPFQPAARGVLPVVILGSDRVGAASVDPATILVSGASVKRTGNGDWSANLRDIDGDQREDLMVHVDLDSMHLEPGVDEIVVTGRTREGPRIEGRELVRIVGHPNGDKSIVGPNGKRPHTDAGMDSPLSSVTWDSRLGGAIVRLNGSAPNQIRLVLFDASGRRVATMSESLASGTHERVLRPAREVLPGIYWLRLEHPRGIVVRRVVALR